MGNLLHAKCKISNGSVVPLHSRVLSCCRQCCAAAGVEKISATSNGKGQSRGVEHRVASAEHQYNASCFETIYDDLSNAGNVACERCVPQNACGTCSLQLVHSHNIPFPHHDRVLTHRCGTLDEGSDGVWSQAVHCPFSFSIISAVSVSSFLQLARKWPNLIKHMHRCEVVFLQKSYANGESRNFTKNVRKFGAILLFGAAMEHSVYIGTAIFNNDFQIKKCNLTVDFWKNYYMRERLQIFSIFNYHAWLIPLVQWITISTTFAWNYVDIFLSMIFRCFAIRFRQMHWRIKRHAKKQMPDEFWQQVRTDFMGLVDLLHRYDDGLSILILVSCCNNLYFICVQIFHSFNNRDNFMKEFYFWFSLLFVLVRILTMMLSAGAVHDEANQIMSTMYEIPTKFWCLELKRLNEIIVHDLVSFSGKGFFYLTRRLIFAMAGTIVVYELVLIDQVEDKDVATDFCTSRNV